MALTTVSLAANRIDAPLALAEDDNAAGAGPGGVDGIPVGDGTTGNDGALGPPANGSAVQPALVVAPAISTRRQRWEKVKLAPNSILELDPFLPTQAPLT